MKYQFQSNPGEVSYRPTLFPNAIKILVSVNFGIFLLQEISKSQQLFFDTLGLVPNQIWSSTPMIWQPFTYMFIHGDIWHVLINMFFLWMFGSELERIWGKERFLKFYFSTGTFSGIIMMFYYGIESGISLIGASGAVYGILLAYGLTYPNRTIYLYGIIPIKSIWFVASLGLIAFISSINNTSNVSHMTHLAGMFIGYLLLKRPVRWKSLWFSIRKKTIEYQVLQKERKLTHIQKIEHDVDMILDKINREGFDKLSKDEQDQLYEGSRSLSRHKKKD